MRRSVNTVTIFFSDNGALETAIVPSGSRAAWFKGGKTQTTEGGTRVPFFVHYPAQLTPCWNHGVYHVTDVLPTLVGLAGGSTTQNRPMDGHDAWGSWATGAASPRTEMLYNVNPRMGDLDQLKAPKAAVRVGEWKLSYECWHSASATNGALFNPTADPM